MVASVANTVVSLTSLNSLGPGLFILIHLQAILGILALIGDLQNEQIIKVLQTKINPLEKNIIPDNWIPKIKLFTFEFAPIFNNALMSNSGF